MLATDIRSATVADIIRRLQSSTYERTAITGLGWGMGAAQENITAACRLAEKAGLLRIETDQRPHMNRKQYVALTEYGKDWTPQPVFTLRYRTENGAQQRVLPAAALERIGAAVMRLANRGQATDIEVLDEAGLDVTFNFACFC